MAQRNAAATGGSADLLGVGDATAEQPSADQPNAAAPGGADPTGDTAAAAGGTEPRSTAAGQSDLEAQLDSLA